MICVYFRAKGEDAFTATVRDLLKGYDNAVRPDYGGAGKTVGVSMYVLGISELSVKNMVGLACILNQTALSPILETLSQIILRALSPNPPGVSPTPSPTAFSPILTASSPILETASPMTSTAFFPILATVLPILTASSPMLSFSIGLPTDT